MPLLLVSFCIGAWVGTSNNRGDKNLFYENKKKHQENMEEKLVF